MNILKIEQFELCQQYLNMTSGIEEGFEYLISSFVDLSKTEGDLVLTDILEALTIIAQTNAILERLFEDDDSILQTIVNFENVVNAAFQLEGRLKDTDAKVKIINNYLFPTFSNWKVSARNALVRYVVQ